MMAALRSALRNPSVEVMGYALVAASSLVAGNAVNHTKLVKLGICEGL